MLGIERIASYVPAQRVSNRELAGRFDTDEGFLRDKLGVLERAVKGADENTSDLACKAVSRLLQATGVPSGSLDALVLVTQNPDNCLPHASAMVHGKLGLSAHCAAFDVSLGCSGYVYGLSVLSSFLSSNGLSRGVLVTSDPYSKIVDRTDKGTAMLFGDAATATMIGPSPIYVFGPFTFGTQGKLADALICRNGRLEMAGREIFNFAAVEVPKDIENLLAKATLDRNDVDAFLFHQGSKYIVETIARRARLPMEKVRIKIENVGNTVSSSIPLLLEAEQDDEKISTIVLSGFGVGLSWASCLLRRTRETNG